MTLNGLGFFAAQSGHSAIGMPSWNTDHLRPESGNLSGSRAVAENGNS